MFLQADSYKLPRQIGKTCLELTNFIDTSLDNCLINIYPSAPFVRESAGVLERIGFRKFSEDIAFIDKPTQAHGFIDSPPTQETPVTVSGNESLEFKGWAILPGIRESLKIVLLSYGSNRVFLTTAVSNLDSPDVARALNSSQYRKVRWSAIIPSLSLPVGEIVVEAWVYNPSSKEFVKLNGAPKVKATGSTASPAIPGVNNIAEISFRPFNQNSPNGFFDGVNDSGAKIIIARRGTLLTAIGWAVLNSGSRADRVIITHGDNNSLLAVVPVNLKRPDIAKFLRNPIFETSGWRATFSSSSFSDRQTVLKAWVYDDVHKEAFQLNNAYQVVLSD